MKNPFNRTQTTPIPEATVPWSIQIFPTPEKENEVTSRHPGLTLEQSIWLLRQIIDDYERGDFTEKGTK